MAQLRTTARAVSVHTFNGVDIKEDVRFCNFNPEGLLEETGSYRRPFAREVAVHNTNTFKMQIQKTVAGVRQTHMDTAEIAVGGTSYLTQAQDFSVSVDNPHFDAKGLAEYHEWAQADRNRTISIELGLMLNQSGGMTEADWAELLGEMTAGNIANLTKEVNIQYAGYTLDVTKMIFQSAPHEVPNTGAQMQRATFKTNIDDESTQIVSPTGSASLLALALYTDPSGALVWNSGGGSYSSIVCHINSYKVSVNKTGTIQEDLDLTTRGAIAQV